MKIKSIRLNGSSILELNQQINENEFEELLPGKAAIKMNLLRRFVSVAAEKVKFSLNEISKSTDMAEDDKQKKIDFILQENNPVNYVAFHETDLDTNLRLYSQDIVNHLIMFLE